MEQWISQGFTLAGGLIAGYLIGYFNHGLTQRREADGRRRKFRDFIRTIQLSYDGIHLMNFVKTYDETVPTVREACIKIFEDIRLLRRHRFIEHRDIYCGFKHS